mmetsp:Transcript_37160/g.40293  ORF Transcript_37160/g.40293 Transcript_37160/m.40293 type:complete len:91 (-) Transcript_37160:16-288(-)
MGTISIIDSYNSKKNNNKTNDNSIKANNDKRIPEQTRETKRQHKQVIEKESKHDTGTITKELDSKQANKRLRKKRRKRQHSVDVKQLDWT